MRKFQSIALVTTLGLSLAMSPTAQAKAKVTKPSAPTISAISSSAAKKGKVNVTVTITLPASNGGSKITGSKVTAGGKSCTIAKIKTSCTIKSITNGKSLSVSANSKNIKGFGGKSNRVAYSAGASAWPTAQVAPVVSDSPAASSPTTPVAAPAPLTCATGGTCVVGNTGPGGGLIFYVNNAGFNCGSGFTATGSPTGGLCKYLEVAPSGWHPTAETVGLPWALANTNIDGIENVEIVDELSAARIGLGYKNSVLIVAQGNHTTTAAGAARAYRGGSKDDWYLPSVTELNFLCQWNRGLELDTGICSGGTFNSGLGAALASFGQDFYWSSSEDIDPVAASGMAFHYDSGAYSSASKDGIDFVRPVRAF